jgi:hypothetical protein
MHDRRPRWRIHTLGTLVVAALWLATLSAATPSAGASASRQRVTEAQYNFSFLLPSGWNQVSLQSANLGALLGARKVNPTLQRSLASEAQRDAAKGVLVFALSSTRDRGGSFPNLNIVAIAQTGASTTNQLEAEIQLGLQQGGAKSVATKVVHYSFGTALLGSYYETDRSSSTGKVYGSQVYVAHGSNIFIVTFTSADKSIVTKAEATAIETWHFSSKA